MKQPKIRVLDDQTINKIAAGEVIENPASVVKELVENSLDAGASCISIEIQEGGRQLIRITDDGVGMAQDDALLCLERHATSKIREVEELEELLTMGFRGEAIPSIAAISKFSLLTCPAPQNDEDVMGTLILAEGGRILSCSKAARSHGTTVEVKSLFYNVPVRRKFQKSPSFDSQEILKVVSSIALGYPTVQFELLSDQKVLLKTIPLRSSDATFQEVLRTRMEAVLGQEYASCMIPIAFNHIPYELEGFIGLPTIHKPNRTGQHLFINQRSITSALVSAAIREGYGTMLPNHRYPVFVLHLRMSGSLVDVNVHPQKKEVRIRREHQLKELLLDAVQSALRQKQGNAEWISDVDQSSPPPSCWLPKGSFSSPNYFFKEDPAIGKWEVQKNEAPLPHYHADESMSHYLPQQPASSPSIHQTCTQELLASIDQAGATPRVIATIIGYCILDSSSLDQRLYGFEASKKEGGLALLDHRAAHRRIRFDHLMKSSYGNESQSLLIPLTWQTTPSEFRLINDYLDLLNRMGFGIREFGENAFLVDSCPHFLKEDQLQDCLALLIQDLSGAQSSRSLQMHREEQLALAACRASLPTAKQLSLEEAQALIAELMMCDLPSQCPLGRPTCLYISPEELQKWFLKKA